MPISAGLRDSIKSAENARTIEYDSKGVSSNNPDHPNYESTSYRAQIGDVELCRDVYGGTKLMRAACLRGDDTYLPRGPHETDQEYKARCNRAVLFPAFEKTVHGLTGMILRKDPVLDGPDRLFEHAQNIDQAGRDFPVFARDMLTAAYIDGHTWGLVEYPRVEPGLVNSRADELALGLRPYWVHLHKATVINWRYEVRQGAPMLTMFAYWSSRQEPDGAFGDTVREIVRVLYPGAWEEWEFVTVDGKPRWQLIDEGQTSLDYIPAVPLYTNRTGFFESVPPLLELAYENIGHWQTRSDRQFTLKFAGSPMPVFIGTDIKGVEWGANRALFIEDPEASAMLLEASGSSLEQQRLELQDIETRMAAIGLQHLVRETRQAETAKAKLIDKAESDSALAVVANSAENAFNEMWRIHADYEKTEPLVVTMNRDYTNQEINPATMMALLNMVQAGRLPLRAMWDVLIRGEILPEDFDHDLAEEELLDPEFDDAGVA